MSNDRVRTKKNLSRADIEGVFCLKMSKEMGCYLRAGGKTISEEQVSSSEWKKSLAIKHPLCSLQVGALKWEEKRERQNLEQSIELSRVLLVIMSIYVLITILFSKFILGVCDLPV